MSVRSHSRPAFSESVFPSNILPFLPDNNSDKSRAPKEQYGKIHVMKIGDDGWTSIGLSTSRFHVNEIQNQSSHAQNHTKHQRAKSALREKEKREFQTNTGGILTFPTMSSSHNAITFSFVLFQRMASK